MQTSRFQLALIGALALALGISLTTTTAIGYPVEAVSRGSNPIWNTGGRVDGSSEVILLTAPIDQDAILVDLLLTKDAGDTICDLELSDGTIVGSYYVQGGDSDKGASPVMHQYSTGVRVPAGMALTLRNSGSYYVRYAVGGYYAQP